MVINFRNREHEVFMKPRSQALIFCYCCRCRCRKKRLSTCSTLSRRRCTSKRCSPFPPATMDRSGKSCSSLLPGNGSFPGNGRATLVRSAAFPFSILFRSLREFSCCLVPWFSFVLFVYCCYFDLTYSSSRFNLFFDLFFPV